MVAVVGVDGGYYEEHRTRYARSYVWRPERVTVECECGERLESTGDGDAVCRCGRDHASTVLEGMGTSGNGEDRPWRSEIDVGVARSERDYEAELAEVDLVRSGE